MHPRMQSFGLPALDASVGWALPLMQQLGPFGYPLRFDSLELEARLLTEMVRWESCRSQHVG